MYTKWEVNVIVFENLNRQNISGKQKKNRIGLVVCKYIKIVTGALRLKSMIQMKIIADTEKLKNQKLKLQKIAIKGSRSDKTLEVKII